ATDLIDIVFCSGCRRSSGFVAACRLVSPAEFLLWQLVAGVFQGVAQVEDQVSQVEDLETQLFSAQRINVSEESFRNIDFPWFTDHGFGSFRNRLIPSLTPRSTLSRRSRRSISRSR